MPCLSHSRAKSGFLSWIPYLVMWLFMILTGTADDYLITRNIISITNVRKLMILLKRKKISSVAEENIKDKILKHGDFLKKYMEPDFGLLDKIQEKGIINSKEIEDVKAEKTPYKKNSALLQHILSNDQSDGLIAALKESDQIHIVNYLKASGEYPSEHRADWPLTDKELNILDTNHKSLVDNLTLTGLLDHLSSSKVVNDRQRESIAAMPTRHQKNQELLKILRRRSLRDYHETIDCLRLSHQGHIAKMLEGGAVVKVHVNLDGENVTEAEKEIVTKIANLLIDPSIQQPSRILELAGLRIAAAKTSQSIVLYIYCRTIKELEQLRESRDSGKLKESVELWFNSLLNRSEKIAVTAITVSNEELRKMRAYFKGTEHQPTEFYDLPLEMLDMILQKSYLHWILNSPTKQRDEEVIRSLMSVDFCFNRRMTRKRFKTTTWRYLKGTEHQPTELCDLPLEMLDVILQKSYLHWIFNSPTKQRDEDVIRSLISVDVCFYQRITRKRFKMSIWRYISKLYDLPFEILDIILQKSYLHWILNSTIKTRDEQVIRSLISVDVCFNQRIVRKRFKKTIWRHLKDFYEKNKKRTAIIRNNRKYLIENIEPNDKLIASLLPLNCITEEQRNMIRQFLKQKHRRKQNKNAELLHFLRSFDEANVSNFVKFLRQTNQRSVARIVESGGVVVKVAIQNCGKMSTQSNEARQLHEKCKNLQNRTKPWSPPIDKLISHLNDKGMEILNSQFDVRTVAVWIWCRSQRALENIQNQYKSNQLKDVCLANVPPSCEITKSMVINIYSSEFQKTVAECQISINFTEKVVKEDEKVYGVSKLQNEIYVLCYANSRPRVINVFEDQNPFCLQKEIAITEMNFPRDIGSSEKDECLYVADYDEKCIWKMTKEADGEYKIIIWVTTDHKPDTLSVSSDGQLIVVNMYESILSIYRSDKSLLRSVKLPTDIIKNTRHAVKLCNENFIIIHQCVKVREGKSGSSRDEDGINWVLSELTGDGKIVVRPSKETQQLADPKAFDPKAFDPKAFDPKAFDPKAFDPKAFDPKAFDPRHLSLDSYGQVFVVDYGNHGVVLLDSYLKWNRLLCPRNEAKETSVQWPQRLFYDEEMKQLIVGGDKGANVHTLIFK